MSLNQILDIASLGLTAYNLAEKLDDLDNFDQNIIYCASSESVFSEQFLYSKPFELKKDDSIFRRFSACVVIESYTIKTWSGLW